MKIFIKEVEIDGKKTIVEIGALNEVQESAYINDGFVEKPEKKKK